MVNRLNRSVSNITATGTSSCTECLSHSGQGGSNNERFQCSCYFINDHTYTILKKICRRMIKDYNRCQCREKYTIFEGGNSINIQIHRSASRGDRTGSLCTAKNRRCISASAEGRTCHDRSQTGKSFEPDSDESSQRNGLGKYRKSNHIDEPNRRKAQKGKIIEERGRDDYDRRNKINYKTSKQGSKDDNVEDYNRKGSKFKASGYKNSKLRSDNGFSKAGKKEKGKGGKIYDGDSSDIDVMNGGRKDKGAKKSSKDSDRDNDRKGAKKGKENSHKSKADRDDEDNRVVARKESKQAKKGKFKYGDNDEDDKNIKRKGGRKSQDKDEKSYEKSKEKVKKGRRSNVDNHENRKQKNHEKNEDIEDGANINRSKKGKKSRTSKDIDDRIITDLREKVRKGLKFSLDIDSSQNGRGIRSGRGIRLFKQFAKSLQCRQPNSTRSDAVRACDYLRANMEQRELCQSVCNPQLCPLQPCVCNPCSCISRTCMTCVCPSSVYTPCPKLSVNVK